jgi:hypothetical protein
MCHCAFNTVELLPSASFTNCAVPPFETLTSGAVTSTSVVAVMLIVGPLWSISTLAVDRDLAVGGHLEDREEPVLVDQIELALLALLRRARRRVVGHRRPG